MNTTCKEILGVMPPWIRTALNGQAWETGEEIRLRAGYPPVLLGQEDSVTLPGTVTVDDLAYILNLASRYSPWSAATVSEGYFTLRGGHRIGICGDAVMKNGMFAGVRNISSMCIRIARDVTNAAAGIQDIRGSVLILGAPGWGKTTLLRDLIRKRSELGQQISVVDERDELFPEGIPRGAGVDVLSGCPKNKGILMLLKTMGPQVIGVDEITEEADARALIQAAFCGVELLATAHAASLEDFLARPVYRELVRNQIFDAAVILHRDKSWHLERSKGWTANGSVRF